MSLILIALFILVSLLLYVWFVQPELIIQLLTRLQVRGAGVTEKNVQAGNYTWSYFERGTPRAGSPTLVLVHGFTMTKENYSTTVKALPKGQHIIVPDMPGHGKTDRIVFPEDVPVAEVMSKKLNEFLRLVGLDQKPIHLAGLSMGGAITTVYSSMYPENIAGASIICPAMATPELSDMTKEMQQGLPCCLIDYSVAGFERKLSMVPNKAPKLPKQLIKGMLNLGRKNEVYYTKLFKILGAPEHAESTVKAAEKVTSPSQVIWGQNDRVLHVSGVEPLKKALPNLKEVHIIPECGHTVVFEKTLKLAQLLVMFQEKYLTKR